MPPTDEPFSLVIFGATGDLTRRKLIPALFALYASRTLPEPFAIVAIARTGMTDDDFRRRMRDAVGEFGRVQPPSESVWERFAAALRYLPSDPTDAAVHAELGRTLERLDDVVVDAGRRRAVQEPVGRAGPRPLGEVFGCGTPEAYERLLLDAIHGDATLYARGDWVEQAWQILEPVLKTWARDSSPLPIYEAGSWGPPEADAFIARDGASWLNP